MHSTSACQFLGKLCVRNWKETVRLFNCLIRKGKNRCQGNRKARGACPSPFERGQSFPTSGIAYNNAIKIKWMVKTASIQAKPYTWILMEQGPVALCTKTELCRGRQWMTRCKTAISSPVTVQLQLMSIQLFCIDHLPAQRMSLWLHLQRAAWEWKPH